MAGALVEGATLADLDTLAAISRDVHLPETITQFIFADWYDEASMLKFFAGGMLRRLREVDTQVFKAVSPDTGEILGFICWTLNRANEQKDELTDPIPQPETTSTEEPIGINTKFLQASTENLESLKRYMVGTEHYYLSTFAVAPKHQGKGIGSQLIRHCLAIADQQRVATWLMSFPGSHSLYGRFGFDDLDHKDIDLNDWDEKKFRGFGIYRTFAMFRPVPPVP